MYPFRLFLASIFFLQVLAICVVLPHSMHLILVPDQLPPINLRPPSHSSIWAGGNGLGFQELQLAIKSSNFSTSLKHYK
jgi:hypothetical protein